MKKVTKAGSRGVTGNHVSICQPFNLLNAVQLQPYVLQVPLFLKDADDLTRDIEQLRLRRWPPARLQGRRPDHEVAWLVVLRGANSTARSAVPPSLLLPPPARTCPRPSPLARRCLPRLARPGFVSCVCVAWPGCCGCGLATRRRLPCRPRRLVASPPPALRCRSRPASCVVSWRVPVGSGSSPLAAPSALSFPLAGVPSRVRPTGGSRARRSRSRALR
eukprot:SAG11_NODE_518_length_8798_cov_5.156110_3_plen_219_part_00